MTTNTIEGSLDGRGLKPAIVVARFNEHVTRRLLDGALATFIARGVDRSALRIVWVPGAFEIPLAGALLLDRSDVDCVIGLGCVIRGETAHFDFVARAAADGILRAGLDARRPFVFGVLTVDTDEQAAARCREGPTNKGAEAALTAIEMCRLRELIEGEENR